MKMDKIKKIKMKIGRSAILMPEKINDTPENVARVLMGLPPDWMEQSEEEKD